MSGTSEVLVTAISYLSALTGLGATFAYLTTFYLTPYNELYLSGESGYDETDVSYTLAIIECVLSGCTFIVGVLAFAAAKSPPRRVVFVAMMFFIVVVILEGTFSTIRAWNLGLVGDDMERTCSDIGITGCPTTRYESKHHPREILYTSPKGGDCQFWYWDNMRPRWNTNACDGVGNVGFGDATICDYSIETFMDWSSAKSYGWRDDPVEIRKLLGAGGSLTTIKKVHNMAELMSIKAGKLMYSSGGNFVQQNYTNNILDPMTVQPSLSYCWYWGCNAVCNSERYFLNRLWLMMSIALTVFHLLLTILAAAVWRKKLRKVEIPMVAAVDIETEKFMVPEFGRRKRRLVKNPSMLQF